MTTDELVAVVRTVKTQAEMAERYRDIVTDPDIDFAIVNRAIIRRWSVAGLKRIKRMAWQ